MTAKIEYSQLIYSINEVFSHVYILLYSLEDDDRHRSFFNTCMNDEGFTDHYIKAKQESFLELKYKELFLVYLKEKLDEYSEGNSTKVYTILSFLTSEILQLILLPIENSALVNNKLLELKFYLKKPRIHAFLTQKLQLVTDHYILTTS
jgi:hypothetical protein